MIFYSSTEQNVPIRLAGIFLLLCWKPVPALLLPFIFLGEKLSFISCWRKWRPLLTPSPEHRRVKHRWWTNAIQIYLSSCPHLHVCSQPRGCWVSSWAAVPRGWKIEGESLKKAPFAAQVDGSALRSRTCCFCQQKEPRCFSIYTGELAEGRLALSCCTFGKDPFFSKSLA